MLTNEKIAHDLTMIYLSNRYGINLTGSFHVDGGEGYGDIVTEHFPDAEAEKMVKVSTGEKGFLGIEKKIKVADGYQTDKLFADIFRNYKVAYSRFLKMLESE